MCQLCHVPERRALTGARTRSRHRISQEKLSSVAMF